MSEVACERRLAQCDNDVESSLLGDLSMTNHAADHLKNDSDRGKGSLEPDEREQAGNNSMQGQIGHRHPDPMVDGADSDFPEPGSSPEYSFEGELKKKSA